jgi:hypothetical protein
MEGPLSLTIDISLAQVALITAGTSGVLRRLSDGETPMTELADRVDRFLDARADTPEARARAAELVGAWQVFLASPRARRFLLAHDERGGIARQDQAVRRMNQLEASLRHEADAAPRHPARATHAAA